MAWNDVYLSDLRYAGWLTRAFFALAFANLGAVGWVYGEHGLSQPLAVHAAAAASVVLALVFLRWGQDGLVRVREDREQQTPEQPEVSV